MKKNKKKIIIGVIIGLIALSAIVDYSRVSKGKDPFLAVVVQMPYDRYYLVGPFYYFKPEFGVSPEQQLHTAMEIKMGIWFLPGFLIYEN